MPLLAAILLYFLFIPPAHAYLDPGTGSMMLQAIIGGLVAGASAITLYWGRIKSYFNKKKPPSDDPKDKAG